MEFPLCFFIIVFFIVLPFFNVILSPLVLMSLNSYNQNLCLKAASCEDRETALATVTNSKSQLANPFITIFHRVDITGKQAASLKLEIILRDRDKNCQRISFPAERELANELKPGLPEAISKYSYSYRLTSTYLVHPIINLDSIPGLKQIPVAAAPYQLCFSTEEPVRFLRSLN